MERDFNIILQKAYISLIVLVDTAYDLPGWTYYAIYSNKFGMVFIQQYILDTNFGKKYYMGLQTNINGIIYIENRDTICRIERNIKWLACNFLTRIKKELNHTK